MLWLYYSLQTVVKSDCEMSSVHPHHLNARGINASTAELHAETNSRETNSRVIAGGVRARLATSYSNHWIYANNIKSWYSTKVLLCRCSTEKQQRGKKQSRAIAVAGCVGSATWRS
jgi:hypothetical protein